MYLEDNIDFLVNNKVSFENGNEGRLFEAQRRMNKLPLYSGHYDFMIQFHFQTLFEVIKAHSLENGLTYVTLSKLLYLFLPDN
jgi:hypothetical protein